MLSNVQKKHLRSLANNLKANVLIGKNGLTDQVLNSIDQELATNELLKVKYNEFKDEKKELNLRIVEACDCIQVGGVGHTALFFKQNPDPKERKIELPKK